jgi:hypothetical protein
MNLRPRVKFEDLPDVLVENLDFMRTIGNREWRLRAVSAENDSGLIKVKGMYVNVREPDSLREIAINAADGEFMEGASSFGARSVDGVVFLGDRSMDISAPTVSYDSLADMWSFEDGVELWDDDSFIRGGRAALASGGVLSLDKGAYARWKTE